MLHTYTAFSTFKHDTWPCQRALIQVKTSKVWSQQIVFSFNMQQTTTPFLNSCNQWNYLTPVISELKYSHHRQFGIEKLIATTVFKLILKWKLCNSNYYRWFLAVIIYPYPSSHHQMNILTIRSVSQSLGWFRHQVIGEPWFIPLQYHMTIPFHCCLEEQMNLQKFLGLGVMVVSFVNKKSLNV